jgi:phage terminase large subunit-like protein
LTPTGSTSRDWTALIGCTLKDTPHVFVVGIWERNEHDPDRSVPRMEIDARGADAFRRYKVRMMACDPAGWTQEIEGWAMRYGETIVQLIPQTAERMAPACDVFRAELTSGRLTHDGNPALERALGNAVTRETRWGLSIVKDAKNSPRKIDPAVAAVLARLARNLAPQPKARLSAFLV